MKKTYINPSIDVCEIKVSHQLLAGSEIPLGDAGSANNAESRMFCLDFDDNF